MKKLHARILAHITGGLVCCARCGHGSQAHEHYRAGSDCALCSCGRWS